MKAYGFQIDPNIIEYDSAIRSKSNIVRLLINIVRFLSVCKMEPLNSLTIRDDEDSVILILRVDKMSRIIICEKDKIHTFQFPFEIDISNSNARVYYNHIEIDSGVIAVLSATFQNLEDDISIERIIENYWEAIRDFKINDAEAKLYAGLITYFLSFEPGYLRFDHDEENNGINHPVNHLDIYYTNKNTFKIGLQNKLDYAQVIDILNITTPCYTLR